MDFEFRSMVSSEKRSISEKVSLYKEEYSLLSSNFQTIRQSAESYNMKHSTFGRSNLIPINQSLDQATATLEKSRQIIAETENVGTTAISTLTLQRENLLTANDRVVDTGVITSDTKALLSRMGMRAFTQNLVLSSLIVVLAIIIVIVIYFQFIHRTNNS